MKKWSVIRYYPDDKVEIDSSHSDRGAAMTRAKKCQNWEGQFGIKIMVIPTELAIGLRYPIAHAVRAGRRK